MKALVTGASGFIGRRLATELAGRGHDVACLVRRTSRTEGLEACGVRLVVGDLRDPDSLAAAVAGRECVFHLAAVVQAVDRASFEAANVEGTRHLLEACAAASPAVQRFVFVSSVAAAGPSEPGRPGTEADEPRPVSDYGRSKLRAERLVLEAAGRVPVTVIRPPNVFGPGSKDLARAIALIKKRIVPAVGDDLPRTSLIDVDDLVEALILAAADARAVGQTYNVTDGHAYAWPEIMAELAGELGLRRVRISVPAGAQVVAAALAEAASRLTGKPPALTRAIVRAGRDYFWIYDSSKIERQLGFRPRYTMRETVRRTVRAVGPPGGRRGKRGPRERA